MAKLEITLHSKDGDVTYTEEHVSGQKYLDYLTMLDDFSKQSTELTGVEVIKKRLEFVSGLFSNKSLTPEAILMGTDPWDLNPTLDRITNVILGVEEGGSKKELSASELLENNI